MQDVTIIGGGVTGLAAAYLLERDHPELSVSLLESSDRFGGKVISNKVGSLVAEGGPDSIVARNELVADLCRGIGIEEEIIKPKSSKSYLLSRKVLKGLPSGIFGGYPSKGVLALRDSTILSTAGLFRAAMDYILPRKAIHGDVSIGSITRSRFGREFTELLVDPLVGGLMACSSDLLSAQMLMPSLYRLASENRSVMAAARRSEVRAAGAPFFSFRGGIQSFTDGLERSAIHVTKYRNEPVSTILRNGEAWKVEGRTVSIDSRSVIVAVPTYLAAQMFGGLDEELTGLLSSLHYTSVANVVLVYRKGAFMPNVEGTGFLVPEREGMLMTGCSWLSEKWSNAAADDISLVRCFVGTPADTRWMEMDDERLASELHRELGSVVRVTERPVKCLVTRWDRALPQYRVGHAATIERLKSLTPEGVFLAGAAYGGVGISSCVADAARAVVEAAAFCAVGPQRPSGQVRASPG